MNTKEKAQKHDELKRATLRAKYPYKAVIVQGNDYGLPIGKDFNYARIKEGDASPYPVEMYSYGGDYRIYQMRADEVSLTRMSI